MVEMNWIQLEFTYSALEHLLKIKKEYKNLNIHGIDDIFVKTK